MDKFIYLTEATKGNTCVVRPELILIMMQKDHDTVIQCNFSGNVVAVAVREDLVDIMDKIAELDQ